MAKLDGLQDFNRRLAALSAATKAELRTALDESADRVVALQKSLAPVDEGDLRNSIRKEPGEYELQIRIVAGGSATTRAVRAGVTAPRVDYALIAEFGTANRKARPFFYPAYRALRKAIRARLSRAYRNAARRARAGS